MADQIIEQGPFPAGETFTVHCTPAEINELRDELIARRGVTTYEEWRVTGQPKGDYPPYEFTWSPLRHDNPEREAKGYAALMRERGWWTDGPHLRKRTVTVTDWEDA